MYREFKVIGLTSNTLQKTVTFETTFDIDPLSVTPTNIIIYDTEFPSEALEWEDVKVSRCTATITLKQWPFINKKYRLKILSLKNIVNQSLETEHLQSFYFKSKIDHTVIFKAPLLNSNNESLDFIIEENTISDESNQYGSYYIELSSDPLFNKIIYKDYFEGTHFSIKDIDYGGQIFARCRIQKEEDYGEWTILSFNYKKEIIVPDEQNPEVSFEPIFEDDLKVLIQPEQAVTPESFIFIFDCKALADIENIKVVITKRRY